MNFNKKAAFFACEREFCVKAHSCSANDIIIIIIIIYHI